jgi:DNA repair exonuclease SbcCD ATPase subunit
MHREQVLEQKLEHLRNVLRDAQQASNDSWQAIIHEDRLLGRINALEDQLRIYRTKVQTYFSPIESFMVLSFQHMNEDTIKQEIIQLTESHKKFEDESKTKLEKTLVERTDALSRNKILETSLQTKHDELKHLQEQNEQYKQDIQNIGQSIDEQRSLISDVETKLQVIHSVIFVY